MRTTYSLLLLILFMPLIGESQPTIDGDMGDADYTTIATYTSGNDGFGGDNDLGEIKYYTDGTNIFMGITGELTSNDNIILFFNFSGYGGRAAGETLGSGGSTVFNNIGGSAMDFDTDFALAFNEGSGTTNFFVDGARYDTGGYNTSGALGSTGSQAGGANSFEAGGMFGGGMGNNITAAYNSTFASDTDKGVEFSIPISAFAGVTNTQTLQVFAIISNFGGFFSNESIPGNPGGGNPGANFDFSSVGGQDFFTSALTLPVQLTQFNATPKNGEVMLDWQTVSEEENSHFNVETSIDGRTFSEIGKVNGIGTIIERQDYSFLHETPKPGINYYRLAQIDYDGQVNYSRVVSVDFDEPVIGIYPNPASERVFVNLTDEFSGNVQIFNLRGQLIQSHLVDRQELMELNVNDLIDGVYLVRIVDGNGFLVDSQKFIKL